MAHRVSVDGGRRVGGRLAEPEEGVRSEDETGALGWELSAERTGGEGVDRAEARAQPPLALGGGAARQGPGQGASDHVVVDIAIVSTTAATNATIATATTATTAATATAATAAAGAARCCPSLHLFVRRDSCYESCHLVR